MLPWQILARTKTPDGDDLVLRQRGDEYTIRVANSELMSSRAHLSEDTLGAHGAGAVAKRTSPRVLIGGLGMGFTLRAALDVLPADARIDVSELISDVVEWNRGPLAHLAGNPLADPRVRIIEGDVAIVLARNRNAYDAVLLDVDNGPEALTADANTGLYSDSGVLRVANALRPEGVFGVWSAFDAPRFSTRLRRYGFTVEIEKVRAYPGGGARHQLWMAVRPSVLPEKPKPVVATSNVKRAPAKKPGRLDAWRGRK